MRRISCYALLLGLVLLQLATAPATAQNLTTKQLLTTKQVKISIKNGDVMEALRSLQKQTGLNFLLDNAPDTIKANLEFEGSADKALEKIITLYDYQYTIGKTGAILMHRAFLTSRSLPQLNRPELIATLTDILTIIKSVPHDSKVTPRNYGFRAGFRKVALSLSTEQVQFLRTGQQLPIASLSQEQRAMLTQGLLDEHLGLGGIQISNYRDIFTAVDKGVILKREELHHATIKYLLAQANSKILFTFQTN